MTHRSSTEIVRLRVLPIFSGASTKTLQCLDRVSDVVHVPAGTPFHAHTRLSWVYGIMAGSVSVEQASEVHIARAGEVIGVSAALTNHRPEATLTALTDATLLVMSQRAFLGFASEHPTLGVMIARQIALKTLDD